MFGEDDVREGRLSIGETCSSGYKGVAEGAETLFTLELICLSLGAHGFYKTPADAPLQVRLSWCSR